MNISLPPAMAEFVRRRVERNYGNASEFFRELVRASMEREIETDLAFLETTRKGAKPGPTEAEIDEVLALQRRTRKGRHARRL
jgi:Arc/MetJ-type ribon-helix-helix transcriptional regulator